MAESLLPKQSVLEPHPVQEGWLRIFKSRLARIQYVFRDGSLAVFAPRTGETSGHYLTDDPMKIAELEDIAKKNHIHIYMDPKDMAVETRLADPAVAAREQIAVAEREKLIAMLGDPNQLKGAGIDPEAMQKLIASIQATRDMGSTEAKPELQGIANSTTIAAAAVDSNGAAVNASPTGSQVPAAGIQIKKVGS